MSQFYCYFLTLIYLLENKITKCLHKTRLKTLSNQNTNMFTFFQILNMKNSIHILCSSSLKFTSTIRLKKKTLNFHSLFLIKLMVNLWRHFHSMHSLLSYFFKLLLCVYIYSLFSFNLISIASSIFQVFAKRIFLLHVNKYLNLYQYELLQVIRKTYFEEMTLSIMQTICWHFCYKNKNNSFNIKLVQKNIFYNRITCRLKRNWCK